MLHRLTRPLHDHVLTDVAQANKTMAGVEVSAWGAVRNWRTWYLALINLCDSTVKYAIIYWCPLIIYHMVGENMPHATGEAVVPHDAVVALLTALPFGFAAVFMLVNARHSAATGEASANVHVRGLTSICLSVCMHVCVHARAHLRVFVRVCVRVCLCLCECDDIHAISRHVLCVSTQQSLCWSNARQ